MVWGGCDVIIVHMMMSREHELWWATVSRQKAPKN